MVVPARDEQELLPGCLASVVRATPQCPVPVAVVVVLDRCRDSSGKVAREALTAHEGPWCVLDVVAPCVAAVRDHGVAAALSLLDGVTPDADRVWLANTDADTVVPPDWLGRHLDLATAGADVVAGFARLDDDAELSPSARRRYDAYMAAFARDDGTHVHVYGANLGVRASAWRAVGGFPRVAVGEDAALLAAVQVAGGRVVRPVEPSVTTSGRRHGRAPGGLADLLDSLEPQPRPPEMWTSACGGSLRRT